MKRNGFWQVLGTGSVLIVVAAVYGAQGSSEKGDHQAGHDHAAAHAEHPATGPNGLSIPQPLTIEHQGLHEELLKGTKETGQVGEAAQAVADLLHPHFVKEEEYALPLLGLLVPVSKGDKVPHAEEAVAMAGKLKADLPHMLQEHRQIVAALQALKKAAHSAGKPEYVHFAEKLTLHAQTEEQVLYPAAILVGEHLKTKMSK